MKKQLLCGKSNTSGVPNTELIRCRCNFEAVGGIYGLLRLQGGRAASAEWRNRAQNSFSRAPSKTTPMFPAACAIIPGTKFVFTTAWPVRPSATRHLLSLMGPSRFLVSAEFLSFPPRDPPLPTEDDGFERGRGGKSGGAYIQGPH